LKQAFSEQNEKNENSLFRTRFFSSAFFFFKKKVDKKNE
jgi:hypothetical protein